MLSVLVDTASIASFAEAVAAPADIQALVASQDPARTASSAPLQGLVNVCEASILYDELVVDAATINTSPGGPEGFARIADWTRSEPPLGDAEQDRLLDLAGRLALALGEVPGGGTEAMFLALRECLRAVSSESPGVTSSVQGTRRVVGRLRAAGFSSLAARLSRAVEQREATGSWERYHPESTALPPVVSGLDPAADLEPIRRRLLREAGASHPVVGEIWRALSPDLQRAHLDRIAYYLCLASLRGLPLALHPFRIWVAPGATELPLPVRILERVVELVRRPHEDATHAWFGTQSLPVPALFTYVFREQRRTGEPYDVVVREVRESKEAERFRGWVAELAEALGEGDLGHAASAQHQLAEACDHWSKSLAVGHSNKRIKVSLAGFSTDVDVPDVDLSARRGRAPLMFLHQVVSRF